MYVPTLKKNLVYVVMLEDRGYDVIFSEGNVFLQGRCGPGKWTTIEKQIQH